MCSCNINRIQDWTVLVSTQSKTAPECSVIFVAVVHRMGKNDWDIGLVIFGLFKLYILRKSENVCLMVPVICDSSAQKHVKHQTPKSVLPLILFTQQDSPCSTIAAEKDGKSRSGQMTGSAFQHNH